MNKHHPPRPSPKNPDPRKNHGDQKNHGDHHHQLVVMDMDSTLIEQEAIDLLGYAVGKGEEMSRITAEAMAGRLDFEQAITQRVEMLAGLGTSHIEKVKNQLTLTPGAELFFKTVKSFGYKTALVSGGFSFFVEPLAERLEIDHTLSNTLEIKKDKLTGKLLPPIIDRAAKAQFLIDTAADENIPLNKTVAVGDGANDADMLATAGLGIAFCAHPSLQEKADISINVPDLAPILSILGHSYQE